MSVLKGTGKKGYPITDQNNKRAAASKGSDGVMPSKKAGVVTRKTGTAGFGIANQGNSLIGKPSRSKDTSGMEVTSHDDGTAMSDGGKNRPAHGASKLKKWTTNDMAQALRRRQKVAQTPD